MDFKAIKVGLRVKITRLSDGVWLAKVNPRYLVNRRLGVSGVIVGSLPVSIFGSLPGENRRAWWVEQEGEKTAVYLSDELEPA